MNNLFDKILTDGNPIKATLEEVKKSDDEFSKYFASIIELYFKKGRSLEVYNQLCKIDIFKSPSSQLSFIYYMFKSDLELFDYNYSSLDLSLINAKEYIATNDPVSIKYWHDFMSNRSKRTHLIAPKVLKILKKLNIKNNFDFWLWQSIVYFFGLKKYSHTI